MKKFSTKKSQQQKSDRLSSYNYYSTSNLQLAQGTVFDESDNANSMECSIQVKVNSQRSLPFLRSLAFLSLFFARNWLSFPFLRSFIVIFHHFWHVNRYMQGKCYKFDTNNAENDCEHAHCIQSLSVTHCCGKYTTAMLQNCTILTLSAN